VAGYKRTWFTRLQMVTHPSSNQAWHRVTSSIETNVLPLSQAATISECVMMCECQSSGVHGRWIDVARWTSSQPGWRWDATTRASTQCTAAACTASDGEEQGCRSFSLLL